VSPAPEPLTIFASFLFVAKIHRLCYNLSILNPDTKGRNVSYLNFIGFGATAIISKKLFRGFGVG